MASVSSTDSRNTPCQRGLCQWLQGFHQCICRSDAMTIFWKDKGLFKIVFLSYFIHRIWFSNSVSIFFKCLTSDKWMLTWERFMCFLILNKNTEILCSIFLKLPYEYLFKYLSELRHFSAMYLLIWVGWGIVFRLARAVPDQRSMSKNHFCLRCQRL